jgi:hypothetical protein
MAQSIGPTTTVSHGTKIRAKQIGIKQDRNVAKHTPKPRNNMPKLQKLLSKGHLVPIYEAREQTGDNSPSQI